eukprot:TRINITY_DN4598_c0_g1_i1.p1 TRINITY_DN4598_c0_g1~~TRINITY_DN4598_c0_g1_i1.p1  ORF type:complete len:316 (-),score=68.85 TRINITY_DN4598_c0_g1_i1:19-966(-)
MEFTIDGYKKAAALGETAFFTLAPVDSTKIVSYESVKVSVNGPSPVDVAVYDNTDGSFDVEWEPKTGGKYSISIQIDGEHIKGSPFPVNVSDNIRDSALPGGGNGDESDEENDPTGAMCAASKETIVGPGLWGEKIKPDSTDYVYVLTPKTKKGKPLSLNVNNIETKFVSRNGESKPGIYDNGDDTYDIEWDYPGPGNYTLHITHEGRPVLPPLNINLEISSARVEGPGLETPKIKEDTSFTVYTEGETNVGEEDVMVSIVSEDGSTDVDVDVFDNGDESFDVEFYLTKDAPYLIEVFVKGKPAPGSPFRVETAG